MIGWFAGIWLAAANLMLPVETLDGKARLFPADIAAPAVCVVTFDRDASAQAAEWSAELRKALPPAAVVQVAVIEDVPAILRSFVVKQIRRSVPENMRSSFLVATKQSADWKRMASYSSSSVAYVLVTNRDGSVRWRGRGPFNRDELSRIRTAWQSTP